MTEKVNGIQTVVLEIIETSRDNHLPYITKSAIVEEAKKTSLGEFAEKHHVGDKKTSLDRKVEQALMHLKKKGLICQKKRGHWMANRKPKKYTPKVCKALQYEYEYHCPKCNSYSYEKSNKKEVLGGKCKACSKGRLSVRLFRHYCPVRVTYIGDPVRQCELLHGTNVHTMTKDPQPMKFCYFDKVPTKIQIEMRQERVREVQEKEDEEQRIYESKFHLPRPLAPEGK